MNERRGHWYLLTGLAIGAILGLLYSWLVQPVQYTNTTPATLRSEFKDQYRAMIAAAYVANGDLLRAKARLELLQDENVAQVLAQQAQKSLADGRFPEEARDLALLAVALGEAPPATPPPAPQATGGSSPEEAATLSAEAPTLSPLTATPTGVFSPTLAPETLVPETLVPKTLVPKTLTTDSFTITPGTQSIATRIPQFTTTPLPTITPLPSRTPTPTLGAPFVLGSQDLVCDPDLTEGLIQVRALDAAGGPVPGVGFVITWDGGNNHFYSGLKPELGLDYADFRMTPDIVYVLQPADGGQPLPNLTAPECEANNGERYWGGWQIIYAQP